MKRYAQRMVFRNAGFLLARALLGVLVLILACSVDAPAPEQLGSVEQAFCTEGGCPTGSSCCGGITCCSSSQACCDVNAAAPEHAAADRAASRPRSAPVAPAVSA